jgi:succinate dehydrogenase/fumarate reductase flavoprotein subunit
MTDLLVIGGGAAGLMAAGAACARGLTVTVLEHNPSSRGPRMN